MLDRSFADVKASPAGHDAFTPELRREIREPLVKTGDRDRIGKDRDRARADLRALLPDLAAVFGPDHPETRHVQVLLEHLDSLGR
ncbi:hypothetical protein [Streptosporangium sp. V21-05]|uniref:hypothetical protein n=1 Tax=Streptosporangium sp. V21-05 TaxID=3446115 RepID=UPI003F53430E